MRRHLLWAVLLVVACSPTPEQPAEAPRPPAMAAGDADGGWDKGAMVSAANPHAVQAATEMLVRGGHAVDAAIAAHAVLGLVEPVSSGLGGSAFMLVYQRPDDELVFYDGRETAPAAATADMFMRDGEAMSFMSAWQTGISVGVPGAVAAYQSAHDAHGKLAWAELFEPAIRLATAGFEVSPRMHRWLERMQPMLNLEHSPAAAAYLYPDGEPAAVGFVRTNPEYAATLRRIASEGSSAFYQGEIAEAIVARVQQAPVGGSLSLEDLAAYSVEVREALCGDYGEATICSSPPPASGVAVVMIPALYERLLEAPDADLATRIETFVDAQRLAYADRDRYIADPDFVETPALELVEPHYLDQRATERFAPNDTPRAGKPGGAQKAARWGADSSTEAVGTSHLSIIDGQGNAVSMTASVGAPFGSLRWTHGFLLNNELSDFARNPVVDGLPAANAVAPGKRPRSSMSPTMVFDKNDALLMLTGSPGGNSIIAYTAKSILAWMDWGLGAQQAADFPNIIARGEPVRVENLTPAGQAVAEDLAAAGYPIKQSQGEDSGIHLIVVEPDGLEGAADSRREGIVKTVRPGAE